MRSGRDGRSTKSVGAAVALTLLAACPAAAQDAARTTLPVSVSPPVLSGPDDHARAARCLATAIAYEAGFEPLEGQQAVAEVILNRVRDLLYPKSICGVVFAGADRRTGCQFSFTCDGAMRRPLPGRVVAAAQAVAEAALAGLNPVRVAGATHYHASYVSPYWAPSLLRVTRIGAHIFYRLPGGAGRMTLARGFAPSGEPLIAALTGREDAGGGVSAAVPTRAPSAPFTLWGLKP